MVVVDAAEQWSLRRCRTEASPLYESKADYKRRLREASHDIRNLQTLLRADGRTALLVIVQGMDASGKDGTIRRVFGGTDPQSCLVVSFDRPSPHEDNHDFLWRYVAHLPERGHIGVFNRSYYEDVLVPRVHPELLRAQHLDVDAMKAVLRGRYRSIVDFEEHLRRSGTRVVKFFLHVSAAEQRRRLLRRIERPEKNWKIDPDDIAEHRRWKDYFDAYDDCLRHTASKRSPWLVVPADDKRNARLLVAETVRNTLTALRMRYARPSSRRRDELKEMRRLLD